MDLPIYLSFVSLGFLIVYWLVEASFSSGSFWTTFFADLGVSVCPGRSAGPCSGG
jgi:hypothetical protein